MKDNWENLGVDGKTILKLISEKLNAMMWTEFV
jgi:hypothetical protein